MSEIWKRAYLMALGMAAMVQSGGMYHGEPRTYVPDGPKVVTKRKGPLMHYTFEDGFECDAPSPEHAEKKHRKWWKEVGRFKH